MDNKKESEKQRSVWKDKSPDKKEEDACSSQDDDVVFSDYAEVKHKLKLF